jgi:hypothetical protein
VRAGVSRRAALAGLVLAVIAFAAGCQRDARPTVLHGLVVNMQVASFVQIGSFTLRTDDGQLVELAVEGDVGITAGHLREHMTLADPVIVTVRYEGDRAIATRVDDAATPTPLSAPAKP